MGSMVNRGKDRRGLDVWDLRVSLGFDPETRKYPRYTERFHGTKTDARRRLRRLEVDRDGGELTPRPAEEQRGEPATSAPVAVSRHERVRRVVQLRQDGRSLRAIAAEVGVTKSQVERDLAGVPPGGTPATTMGRDGKTYPASGRRRNCGEA